MNDTCGLIRAYKGHTHLCCNWLTLVFPSRWKSWDQRGQQGLLWGFVPVLAYLWRCDWGGNPWVAGDIVLKNKWPSLKVWRERLFSECLSDAMLYEYGNVFINVGFFCVPMDKVLHTIYIPVNWYNLYWLAKIWCLLKTSCAGQGGPSYSTFLPWNWKLCCETTGVQPRGGGGTRIGKMPWGRQTILTGGGLDPLPSKKRNMSGQKGISQTKTRANFSGTKELVRKDIIFGSLYWHWC